MHMHDTDVGSQKKKKESTHHAKLSSKTAKPSLPRSILEPYFMLQEILSVTTWPEASWKVLIARNKKSI